jgi:hypothetical protein
VEYQLWSWVLAALDEQQLISADMKTETHSP